MHESSLPVAYVTWAGVAVVFINWLKKSPYFPWIEEGRTYLLRTVAVVTSFLGAAGISYSWDAHTRILAFSLPTIAGFAHFVFGHWLPSFVTQEFMYQATGNGRPAGVANPAMYQGATQPAANPSSKAVKP